MRNFNSGAATLGITTNINDVQRSNYNGNSFVIKNVGNKKIANVVIDVSQALYPDAVFDPFGKAGDTASKALTINTNGGTGIVNPSNASYIGAGGKKGYEAIRLTFNENSNNGAASGNKILSFVGQGKNETGSVTFNFTGQADSYDLKIGAFDEQDGQASLRIAHYDVETDRTSAIAAFNLDRNLGSNLANSQTFISPTVASGIDLTPGDSITVIGLENASEHARLDYIELNSSGS